jgi:hypothetical protein
MCTARAAGTTTTPMSRMCTGRDVATTMGMTTGMGMTTNMATATDTDRPTVASAMPKRHSC